MAECGLMEDTIREILVQVLRLPIPPDEIGRDDVLFYADCQVDSVAAVEIVAGIERSFGIVLNDDDVVADIFESVRSLSDLVSKKLRESNTPYDGA